MTDKEKTTGVPLEDDALDKVAGGVISTEGFDYESGEADETPRSPEEMRELINQVSSEIAYLNYYCPYIYPCERKWDRERER